MNDLLTDFPPGPLDYYRQKASFNWRVLKLFIYGEEDINNMHETYEELRKYPEFHPTNTPLSFDEERHLTFKQCAIIRANEGKLLKYPRCLTYYPSASVRHSLTIRLFTSLIESMGNERHRHFLEETRHGKISGCFCLTEVGHGSNVKGMRTRATYDKRSKEFVIHTPDFQAAKCWIGGLGTSCTHVLLYCQLYLDDKNYGMHTFVVPIRDRDTLVPFPGITVGDMGQKMGLNGIDNGFLLFNNYRVPRENLLNKNGDVTEDGRYVTPIKDESKRFGAALLALTSSRAGIINSNVLNGLRALTIAVRYAGVRRQFGNENDETRILEYQTHQYRLLPYLAAAYVIQNAGRFIEDTFRRNLLKSDTIPNLNDLGVEMHIITSAAKPVSGWLMRDAIQSCREACGGHGYLKAAGLGDVKNNQDAAVTYEGENWVLIQQTANYLLKLWDDIQRGAKIALPLKSVDFLNSFTTILQTGKFSSINVEETCLPHTILNTYRWLICYLLKQTHDRQATLVRSGASKLTVKNDTQVFYARKLGIAFAEHFFLQKFTEWVAQAPDLPTQTVLQKLFSLYGLFSLEKFIGILYQGGYASGEQPAQLIQDAIEDLLGKLKNDAVALVDVVAPPDFVLNSVLGASDGQVYHHLENSFLTSPYGAERPTWWRDVVNWKDIVPKATSKL